MGDESREKYQTFELIEEQQQNYKVILKKLEEYYLLIQAVMTYFLLQRQEEIKVWIVDSNNYKTV